MSEEKMEVGKSAEYFKLINYLYTDIFIVCQVVSTLFQLVHIYEKVIKSLANCI